MSSLYISRDLEKQPVEDHTVQWMEEDSPFQTVATIRAGRQDSWDDAQVQKVNEEMRFPLWTGLLAHQPLGNIKAFIYECDPVVQNSNFA